MSLSLLLNAIAIPAHHCALFLLLAYLAYCAYTDYASLLLPTPLSALPYVATLFYFVTNLTLREAGMRILGAAIIFGMFYLMARLLGGGGGDAVVVPLVALVAGFVPALLIIIGACAVTGIAILVRACIRREKPKANAEYPFIPGVAICYAMYFVYYHIAIFLGGPV